MSGDITRYVASIHFHEEALTEINELNNHMTLAGFVLTLTDDEGTVHELGTNTFGLITPQSQEDVTTLAQGLAETALGRPAEVSVITFEQWLKENKAH